LIAIWFLIEVWITHLSPYWLLLWTQTI